MPLLARLTHTAVSSLTAVCFFVCFSQRCGKIAQKIPLATLCFEEVGA